MRIYQYTDYRRFLRDTLQALPAKGRGELQKMARHAGIHSSVLSQVFQEKRELTPEQSVAVAHYLELGDTESLYFLLLTQIARAGTERLRSVYRAELEKLRRAQTQVATRARPSRALTHEEKAVFYSSWHYSAVRVLSALPHARSKEALRKKVGLPPEKFRRVTQFLLEHGLLREDETGYSPGLHWTHLEGDSPPRRPPPRELAPQGDGKAPGDGYGKRARLYLPHGAFARGRRAHSLPPRRRDRRNHEARGAFGIRDGLLPQSRLARSLKGAALAAARSPRLRTKRRATAFPSPFSRDIDAPSLRRPFSRP
jgi:hypothetical protein